ncbi:Dyp-type peroxidase [Pararoseomonas baculiformis]|uniref:Dyp-type peroxidase n=1 Tax=Pararoseomonas baculiformis TaxID=2820812 RepID=UPI001AE08444|nr:hypothetical protein [Pararoseomonas baculiformis]
MTEAKPSAWALAPDVAEQTQGFVASSFGWLPEGRALLLDATGAQKGWLGALRAAAPITDAALRPREARGDRAAAIAFTFSGLCTLGLDPEALASFARPFREGMFQIDRARRLGDRRFGEWQKTVRDGGPEWSGNPETPALPKPARAYATAYVDDSAEAEPEPSPLTAHALLLLYARTDADAGAWAGEVAAVLGRFGVATVRALELEMNVEQRDEATGVSREHFGFADGLSQPIPYDDDPGSRAVERGGVPVAEGDRVHGVRLGEILLGFRNAYGELPPVPGVARPDAQPGSRPSAEMADAWRRLPPHPEAEGFGDLGKHGTYLVVRQLSQDVPAFWASMGAAAARLNAAAPELPEPVTADWMAARVVGRTRDGHLLCPKGPRPGLPPAGSPDNDFLFLQDDPHGLGCPLGSHVRRGHPRDGLSATPGDAETLLRAANNHRILRRARKYGPSYETAPEEKERGLLFMCLNTDIARHFEFVQQTWLLNRDFAGLRDEQDPLVGPKGRFTIPAEPFRHALQVETFIRLMGGEYFFLPGIAALDYIAATEREGNAT